jgi:predicted transcriptional regulator
MAGRPEYQPTDKDREVVRALVGFGMPLESIAQVVGITFKTLKKHFDAEINSGKAIVDSAVYAALFQSIKRGNVASIIFYLKTQKGWKETERHEHTGKDGEPIQMYVDRAKKETPEEWLARVQQEAANKE